MRARASAPGSPPSSPGKLESLSTRELLMTLQRADRQALAAVEVALPAVERAVEALVRSWRRGGRLVYVGAGTSGRLGALDAAECPPTFGVPDERVLSIIAGGPTALLNAQEAAEDDGAAGRAAIDELLIGAADLVVALSASGITAFTCAALERAGQRGATTVAITCHENSRVAELAEIPVVVAVGEEIIDGSTRLKAGTAQKLVCNSLSSAAFIRLGRVCDRYMVAARTSSAKLERRAQAILVALHACDAVEAEQQLEAAGGNLPTALLMARTGIDRAAAERFLQEADDNVPLALREAILHSPGP
ncbi:MAG: N-acetylmuramic acid 6-phosphate etherase [Acidobacteriota bacterium]